MASFELELRNAPNKRKECPVVLRITSNGVVTRKNTGIRVEIKYWDKEKSRVKSSHVNAVEYNNALADLLNKAMSTHAVKMKNNIHVTGKEILKDIFSTHDFKEIIQKKIDSLDKPATYRTQKKYITLKNLIDEYYPGNLIIENINEDFVNGFKDWLITKKRNKHNTVVNRLSSLRSVFNDSGLKLPSPFHEKSVVVGSYRPASVDELTMEEIRTIWEYKSDIVTEEFARDTFLFSFYTAGMRSGDVLTLLWNEVKENEIVYRPSKVESTTGVKLIIPLNKYSREILSRYTPGTTTVFNKLRNLEGMACLKEIETHQSTINASLKEIARKTKIHKNISFKYARTTFARIANQKSKRDIYGIKEAMGHSKIGTTEIYLGNDVSAIAELLEMVYE